MIDSKGRLVLAALGAHGILGHNSADRMPCDFTERQIFDLIHIGTAELSSRLEILERKGFVSSRDTGYYGYGDHYVEGVITWQITAAGLIALWTGTAR